MQIFYITADFDLLEKPFWLDAFRAKYDDPYDYHMTLKQGTFFEESRLPEIEKTIQDITNSFSPISITFNTLAINKTPKGHVIMLKADSSPDLRNLQKELREALSKFGEIIEEYYIPFEQNFDPHITIARHLSDEKLVEAKTELGEDVFCRAIINDVTLKVNSISSDLLIPDFAKSFKLA